MTLALTSTCVGGRRAPLPCELPCELPEPIIPAKRGVTWSLTARQTEVIETVIRIGTCIGAASALGLSIKTIEAHMDNARGRVNVDTNYQLIAAYAAARSGGFE
ncbi:MAG: hypothetical protein EOP35_01740 [Rubrivivax sp.]|nr:MAG: hypothetical protein EOP35_01740 [Rubrivivax sp.]